MKDIRELRGRYEYLEWQFLEERVRSLRRHRSNLSFDAPSAAETHPDALAEEPLLSEATPSPSDCGVAAIVSNHFIPSHVMDLMLDRMANRGMDGVGIWKGGCYPLHLDHYALHLLVKGILQEDVEAEHLPAIRSPSEKSVSGRGRRFWTSA